MTKLIYVASPYSHSDPKVIHSRFEAVQRYMAHTAFMPGVVRFSPIVANHEMAVKFSLKGDAEAWEQYNRTFFERCDYMELLMLEGVSKSQGVRMELQWAKELNIKVANVYPLQNGYAYAHTIPQTL